MDQRDRLGEYTTAPVASAVGEHVAVVDRLGVRTLPRVAGWSE